MEQRQPDPNKPLPLVLQNSECASNFIPCHAPTPAKHTTHPGATANGAWPQAAISGLKPFL
jgi:hypothetical protein